MILYTASRCMYKAEVVVLCVITLVLAVPWYVAEWTGLRGNEW